MAEELNKQTTEQTDPTKPTIRSRWSGMSKLKKILLIVLVAIVAIFIIASFATSGVSTASNKFVDNLLQGNSGSAYSMLSPEAQKTVSEADFASVVNRMDDVLADSAKQVSKDVQSETGSASTGTVVYEIKGTDGTYKLTVNLTKVDGDWKVLNFENTMKD
jgi:hypothetical protein